MGATKERTVIVGFDGSPPSRNAVRWAAHAAIARHARLRIISCYEVPIEAPMAPASGEGAAEAFDVVNAQVLAVAAEVHAESPTLDVHPEIAGGTPAGVLRRAAVDADLLVVGASSHHGLGALFLGSTARAVVRKSPVPVVVVHRPPSATGLRRVVVGVDGSPAADAAIRWAVDTADRNRATLLLVHCWTPSAHVADAPSDIDEVDAAMLLDRAVERARERAGTEVEQLLVMADPGQQLAAIAGEGDVLVLGRPHHGAVLSGLLGSAVNATLERAEVPVVVVAPCGTGDGAKMG